MGTDPITLLAVGDILIDREKPEEVFQHTVDVLRSGDITFANCDQNYSDKGSPNRIHASLSDPKNIPALLHAGLDVVSMGNNHTLDWGPEGLLDTLARLRAVGLPYVGAGKDIAEARQPVILERKGNKVGFLAYACTGPDGYEAEVDKPGHAPVRIWTIYDKRDYQPATPPTVVSFSKKEDLAAMVEDIKRLKAEVDVAVVSIHWGLHHVPRVIPMYCFEVGHAAIDAGADLILGGHPHMLKGAEVYKGKTIFYSLGNFCLNVIGPGTHKSNTKRPMSKSRDVYNFVPDPAYPMYPFHPESKASMIAKAIIADGEIKSVSYIPCYINPNAEPEIFTRREPKGREVYEYVSSISASEKLPVHFEWQGDGEVLVLP